MAVLDGHMIIGEYEILVWMDRKRYRASITAKPSPAATSYAKHVRTMLDKDRAKLIERVRSWCAAQAKERS